MRWIGDVVVLEELGTRGPRQISSVTDARLHKPH